jgi:hypothetical protein
MREELFMTRRKRTPVTTEFKTDAVGPTRVGDPSIEKVAVDLDSTETEKTRLGLAAAGRVGAADPATQEATSATSSAGDEAHIARTPPKPENQFSSHFAHGLRDGRKLQDAFDDLSPAMPEAALPVPQHSPQVLDKSEKRATERTPERAAATAPPTARRLGEIRNALVALASPRAVRWESNGALASPGMHPYYAYGYPYYAYGYPYYAYGYPYYAYGYSLGYQPAGYNWPGAAYAYGYYGLGYPQWYWALLRAQWQTLNQHVMG